MLVMLVIKFGDNSYFLWLFLYLLNIGDKVIFSDSFHSVSTGISFTYCAGVFEPPESFSPPLRVTSQFIWLILGTYHNISEYII